MNTDNITNIGTKIATMLGTSGIQTKCIWTVESTYNVILELEGMSERFNIPQCYGANGWEAHLYGEVARTARTLAAASLKRHMVFPVDSLEPSKDVERIDSLEAGSYISKHTVPFDLTDHIAGTCDVHLVD